VRVVEEAIGDQVGHGGMPEVIVRSGPAMVARGTVAHRPDVAPPPRTLVAARPSQTPEHLPEPVRERGSYLWC